MSIINMLIFVDAACVTAPADVFTDGSGVAGCCCAVLRQFRGAKSFVVKVIPIQHVLGMGSSDIHEGLMGDQRLFGYTSDCSGLQSFIQADTEPGSLCLGIGPCTIDQFQQELFAIC